MNKPVLTLVVEKPSASALFAPVAARVWPEHTIYFVYTMYIGVYEFKYPRGLSLAEYPFISEPSWKRREDFHWPVHTVDHQGNRALAPVFMDEALRQAETIIFAGDPDGAGAVAYHRLLTEVLGAEVANQARPAASLYSWAERDVERAFTQLSSTADEWFQRILAQGQARRYFDFNYNTNALAIHGAALRATGPVPDGFFLSKYALQLLYLLRDCPCSEGAAVQLLMNRKMGSAASRCAIIDRLKEVGLVEQSSGRAALAVSPRGHALLASLHPDCQDPHFGERYVRWQESWPASKPAMDRYLRTFFGKQKRFAHKLAKESA